MPQWLEERPEVSEKAKKLYAYLKYSQAERVRMADVQPRSPKGSIASRRHVIRLVKELSTHRLILVTNVNHPERGSCANYYRFLLAPLDAVPPEDSNFCMAVQEERGTEFWEESEITVIPTVTLSATLRSDMGNVTPSGARECHSP